MRGRAYHPLLSLPDDVGRSRPHLPRVTADGPAAHRRRLHGIEESTVGRDQRRLHDAGQGEVEAVIVRPQAMPEAVNAVGHIVERQAAQWVAAGV